MALNFLNDGYFAGKVGIGAPSNSKKLEVTGNAGIEGTLTVETSSNNIRLLDSNDSTVNFSVGVNGRFQIRDVGGVTNPFQIEKAALSNSLYIKGNGNVGIGTGNPGGKLDVTYSGTGGSGTQGIGEGLNITSLTPNITFNDTSSSVDNYAIHLNQSVLTLGRYTSATSQSPDLVLTAGKVGIGTVSPTEKLDISGTAIVRSTLFTVGNVHGFNPSFGASFFINNSGGTSYFNTTGGNVGIGTTSPTAKLHIEGDGSIIRLQNNNSDANGTFIDFRDSTGARTGYVGTTGVSDDMFLFTQASKPIRFFTNATERARITGAGNVGIGTTSPSTKLEVAASATTSVDIAHFSNSNDVVKIKHALDGLGSGITSIFDASNNEDIRLSAQSNSWFNAGNVGIGTTSPTAKLHVAGTGLFTGLVSGITPVAAANFVTKAYVDGSGGGTGPFLPLAGGTMTGTNGVVFPDDFKLNLGAGSDLQIYHGGVNSHIDQNGSGDLYIKNTRADGDIFFQGDDGTGSAVANYFLINGGGQETRFQKNTRHNDNVLAQFGNGDDLQIYHDGSNSYITDEGTGILNIRSSNSIKLRTQANEDYLIATEGGSVELYYDNLKKFETTNKGVTVTGEAKANYFKAISSIPSETSANTAYLDFASGNTRIVSKGPDGTTLGGFQILQQASDSSPAETAFSINTSSNAAFAGNVSLITGKQLIFDGGTDATYISEDIADRLRFFVGGAEFMRFTEDTTDTVNFFKDVTVSGDIIIDNSSGDPFLKLKTAAQEYVLRIDQSDSEKFQIRNTTSSVTALSIDTSSNATFAGTVTAGSYFLGDDTSISLATTGAGTVFLRPNGQSSTAQSSFTTTLATIGTSVAITGAATATTATTSTDNNATLTTKGYVDGLVTGVPVYKGTWDASGTAGGTPDLRLAANKVLGNYYIVSTAGSATPNGAGTEPNSWNVGDWCIFSDITPGAGTDLWQKIDNTSVISGAGTGQKVTKWNGTSGAASETLTDGPITFNSNVSNFAGGIGLPDGNDLFWGGGYGSSNPVLAANGTTMKMYPSGVTSGVQFSLSPTLATFSGNVEINKTDPQIKLKAGTQDVAWLGDFGGGTDGQLLLFNNAGVLKVSLNGEANSYINGGNVGIGDTTPLSKLEVAGSIKSTNYDTSHTSESGVTLGYNATEAMAYLETWTSKPLTIRTYNYQAFNISGSEAMRINTTRNVGIGTTSPSSKLTVSGPTTADLAGTNNSIRIENHTSANASPGQLGGGIVFSQKWWSGSASLRVTGGIFGIKNAGNGTFGGGLAFHTQPSSGANMIQRMIIDTSGNVGIGTTSPDANLEVVGTTVTSTVSDGVNAVLIGLAGSNRTTVQFDTADTTHTNRQWGLTNIAGDFYVGRHGLNVMTMLNNGDVGIGTTSPGAKLHLVSSGSDFFPLRLNSSSAKTWQIGVGGTNYYDGQFLLQDSSVGERLRINSAGTFTLPAYNSTNQTGTPTYLLGTDASGTVVKTLSTPSPITSQAASLYDLIPNGAFTTTYAFTSTAGTYAEVMEGSDVITASGTYSVQMFVNDFAVGGTQYSETYSGIMSWASATNTNNGSGDSTISEIVLHRSGHATNSGVTYLRTRETTSANGGKLKLEIMCNKTYTGASNVVFKFVRLI